MRSQTGRFRCIHKTEEEKKIRAAMRRLDELHHLVTNPPIVRLKEPIQRGFIRYYVLSLEAERRADAEVIRAILKQIGTYQLFWRRSFRRGRRAGKNIEIEQPLEKVLIDKWIQNPKLFPDSWRHYFHLEFYRHYYFVFSALHLIRLKVSRHYLTHEKLIDPLWIEEQAELNAWLNRRMGREKYYRMVGIGNRDDLGPTRSEMLETEARLKRHKLKLNPEEAETSRLNEKPVRFSLFASIEINMKYQRDERKHQDEYHERWIARNTNYEWDEFEHAYCDELVFYERRDGALSSLLCKTN